MFWSTKGGHTFCLGRQKIVQLCPLNYEDFALVLQYIYFQKQKLCEHHDSYLKLHLRKQTFTLSKQRNQSIVFSIEFTTELARSTIQ